MFSPVLGWLFTALAVMMGAPFWFDLLNKVMVIRSTVKPHEKSQEEDSDDRQSSKNKIQDVDIEVNVVLSNRAKKPIGNFQPRSGQRQMLEVPAPWDDESALDSCGIHGHDDSGTELLTADEELPQ